MNNIFEPFPILFNKAGKASNKNNKLSSIFNEFGELIKNSYIKYGNEGFEKVKSRMFRLRVQYFELTNKRENMRLFDKLTVVTEISNTELSQIFSDIIEVNMEIMHQLLNEEKQPELKAIKYMPKLIDASLYFEYCLAVYRLYPNIITELKESETEFAIRFRQSFERYAALLIKTNIWKPKIQNYLTQNIEIVTGIIEAEHGDTEKIDMTELERQLTV